jgi:hypothetical protein
VYRGVCPEAVLAPEAAPEAVLAAPRLSSGCSEAALRLLPLPLLRLSSRLPLRLSCRSPATPVAAPEAAPEVSSAAPVGPQDIKWPQYQTWFTKNKGSTLKAIADNGLKLHKASK